ncbi:hypothetical protein CHM34_05140 [Paludifilum halophilum]|uniref:Uncharacterized protein n=1 Tax=Paludifilum halophilum TaxID=1642702 RepID=A0A235BA15_9BACL|nr:hypothetical protein CHM34_05140 [Paludifilum halophilum]
MTRQQRVCKRYGSISGFAADSWQERRAFWAKKVKWAGKSQMKGDEMDPFICLKIAVIGKGSVWIVWKG